MLVAVLTFGLVEDESKGGALRFGVIESLVFGGRSQVTKTCTLRVFVLLCNGL